VALSFGKRFVPGLLTGDLHRYAFAAVYRNRGVHFLRGLRGLRGLRSRLAVPQPLIRIRGSRGSRSSRAMADLQSPTDLRRGRFQRPCNSLDQCA